MSRKLIKKRGPVEIYFILYLAALILLIPDKNENIPENDAESEAAIVPFYINPVKPSLTCRLYIDSSGVRISDFDSENTIHYSGSVKDVKMRFTVIDEETNNSIVLKTDEDTRSGDFSLYHNSDNNLVKFFWKPPIYERKNKNYIVNITAYADPSNIDNSLHGTSDERVPSIVKRAQFRLAVYINRPGKIVYLQSDQDSLSAGLSEKPESVFPMGFSSVQTGEMSMYPVHSPLRAVTNQQWENRIIVIGLNPQTDLAELPEPEVSGNGTAYISGIGPNEIKLSGTAPISGNMRVKLKLTRKYDRRDVSADFSVVPSPIFKPEFTSEMYPGNTYLIDPKLPQLPGQDVKAELKSQEGSILVSSRQGAKMEFSPSESDTGSVLLLERFVNNQKIGQTYSMKVLPLPPPVITGIEEKGERLVTITTKSFGFYKGEKNLIQDVELSGNAKWQEYFPNRSTVTDDNVHRQHFMISPKNGSGQFRFRLRIIDKRGKKSEYILYE